MLIATAKNRKGGKREGRGEFFSNLFISPPPSDEELRVGAGLGAEEEKTLTTRQRCLEDLPSDIVSSKVGVYKVKKSVVLQVWPKLYLCGVSLFSQVSPNKKKKNIA